MVIQAGVATAVAGVLLYYGVGLLFPKPGNQQGGRSQRDPAAGGDAHRQLLSRRRQHLPSKRQLERLDAPGDRPRLEPAYPELQPASRDGVAGAIQHPRVRQQRHRRRPDQHRQVHRREVQRHPRPGGSEAGGHLRGLQGHRRLQRGDTDGQGDGPTAPSSPTR